MKKKIIDEPNRFIVIMDLRTYLSDSEIKSCVTKKFQPDDITIKQIKAK